MTTMATPASDTTWVTRGAGTGGGLSTEHPPPPRARRRWRLPLLWGIIAPIALTLDRLGRFSLVWRVVCGRSFYGRYSRSEGGDNAPVLAVPLVCLRQLLPEVGHLLPEIFDALRLGVR